eukprot:TRINITY_DN6892_c0_g1_i25.p1 TRINITY_DN6892_c0_g1~~TRINITY_DN6892_c0_g1_i25.p1  ORF type:complete len:297 (+),score=70.74 TRINITY_DN6892_c0_g1_i25:740-1630(+)
MEDGSLRCDVNVSVELGGVQGNRCEIKNLNSIKSIGRAIDFEVKRHSQLISKNQPVPQQTRRFDIASGETVAMRSKENSVDYRFMPEPDLPPLILDPKLIQDLAGSLPELPHESTDRLQAQHGLSREAAVVLLGQQGGLVFFEAVVQGEHEVDPKQALNWVSGELMGQLKKHGTGSLGLEDSPVSANQLRELLLLMQAGTISNSAGKQVLEHMLSGDAGSSPKQVAEQLGLQQIQDITLLQQMCAEVMRNNPKEVQEFRAGKTRRMKHLVGQLMKLSKGRADPKLGVRLMTELVQK